MQESLYFTNLVQRRVIDSTGRPVGAVVDLVISSGELFPRITGLVISPGRSGDRLFAPLAAVEDLTSSPIRLSAALSALAPLHLEEGEARLGHTFLDKQIVDTQGVRVVRVNDLKLAVFSDDLRLLGADVGIAGLARRMHAESALQKIAGPLRSKLTDNVIPWNFVDPLSSDRVRLNVTRGRLREMRPADLADVLEQLPVSARTGALAELSDEQIADTLSETRPDVQRSIIDRMEDDRASGILEHMAPDDATDLLQDLEEDRRADLMERMDLGDRQEIAELLTHAKDSAGGRMTTDAVRIPADGTAADAIALLRTIGPDAETVYYLYVVDPEGRLQGVVSLRALITALPSTPLRQLANTRVHSVTVDADQQEAADLIARYNLLALPVVDSSGVMKGIITVDDVIDVLREEATEDVALLASGATGAWDGAPPWYVLARAAWFVFVLVAMLGVGLAALRVPLLPVGAGRGPAVVILPLLLEVANALAFGIATLLGRQIADETDRADLFSAVGAEIRSGWYGALVCVAIAAAICLLWPGVAARERIGVPAGVLFSMVYATVWGLLLPPALARLRFDPTRGLRPLLIGAVSAGSLVIYAGLLRAAGTV